MYLEMKRSTCFVQNLYTPSIASQNLNQINKNSSYLRNITYIYFFYSHMELQRVSTYDSIMPFMEIIN